ncbi:MAG TPA: ATP-binding cassette domain-containing protein [Isosphaeraceae bacterium]|nr:ATP-binding cassette domain-containing protein [Isosphaeraceae bacterium]
MIVGRSGDATLRLLQPTISRKHATLTRAGDGLTIQDHDSRFGTFVNGARIRVISLRPGDRVQFGSATPYRVEPGGLRLEVAAQGMALTAEGLAISVSRDFDLKRLCVGLRVATHNKSWVGLLQRDRLPLIRDVSLQARPDSFVGILGPSGAGKSTLLNCLASYLLPGRGRIFFDDRRDVHAEPDVYRAMLGHVPQDDIVFRSLTIRENLAFAAQLRLGRSTGSGEITASIDQALERVGLAEQTDNLAGVLSGGQRKRLSVAIELLRRPRLLLLDEPTSGLDPASEAHLMEQLHDLARRGTTVICTTHLMDNLRLVDQVIALGVIDGVGRLAYSGPPESLLTHFRCRGFADLYELLASGRFEPVVPSSVATPTEHGASTPPEERRDLAETGLAQPRPDTGSIPSSRRPGIGQLASNLTDLTGWGQFWIIARRAALLWCRDRVLILAMIAQPLLLGLLVCLTQYDIDKTLQLLFFAVVVAIWLGLNNSARDLVRERRYYVRDRLAGLMPGSYLGAKAAMHVAVGAVQILALMAVIRLAGRAFLLSEAAAKSLHDTSVARLLFVLLASYLGGVGLGFLISILVRTEEAAVAALPLLIMPQLLLSVVATGMQIKRNEEERPFRPLVVTILSNQELSRPAVCVDVLSMACLSRPAVLVAESKNVPDYSQWIWLGDLCHLVILLLATWTIVILAFYWAEQRWLRLIGL